MRNKPGPQTIYPEPLSEIICLRVTPQQKEFIMNNTGTSELREILLTHAQAVKSNQLPTEYSKAGAADIWRTDEKTN